MVALTTADDAVWLVRYVASPSLHLSTRIIHAILFVATLECLTIGCVIVAFFLQKSIGDDTYTMGIVGAAICWILALFFFVRKTIKKRRRRRSSVAQSSTCTIEYGAINDGDRENARHVDDASSSSSSSNSTQGEHLDEIPQEPSIWTVITLTTIGALDEISYFPGLLIGGLFSPVELCIGTFLASLLVLAVVGCFIARFKPLLKLLDKIPLYGIISAFAIVLTAGVVYDLLNENKVDS